MLNEFQKNVKTIVKQAINLQTLFSTKSALYFGLAAYWMVILFGTFFNL